MFFHLEQFKWDIQFTGFKVPPEIYKSPGFIDHSYHIDDCPRFLYGGYWLLVDHPEPDRRRATRVSRYTIFSDADGIPCPVPIISTDSVDEALTCISHLDSTIPVNGLVPKD
jgi:hypothetical protein